MDLPNAMSIQGHGPVCKHDTDRRVHAPYEYPRASINALCFFSA